MDKQKPYSWLYYLFLFEGVIALIWLLSIPSEGARISWSRMALIGAILFLCGMWGVIGYRIPGLLDKYGSPPYIWGMAISIPLMAAILFLLRYIDPEQYLPFYERLSPLLWYMLLLAVQLFFFLLFLYKGFYPSNLIQNRSVYLPAGMALTVLLGVFLLISTTRLGLTYDPAYWGEPGVPLLGWQFILALFLGAGVFCALHYLPTHPVDKILPVSIYLLAVLIWLSVPVDVLKNSFYMRITAPDFQPYPFSDSGYYDQMAQSLLVGHPYQGVIPTRPLYIVFLAALHLVFGENYPRILVGQTLVLAILPVILFLLGRKIHGYTAGVVVAIFFIFRELTSLLISSETRVTNTKMLLVDLPTLLLLLVTCLFVFRWLENHKPLDAFVAGGCFGLLLLLRTQSMLVLPFILLIAFFAMGWRNRAFYSQTLLFILGLAVTIAPWLTHNYLQTGRFTFDADFQVNLLVSQYAAFGNMEVSEAAFEGKGLGYILVQFMLRDPGHVFGFISNHFFATTVNALLVLPIIEPYNGLFAPINLHWMEWAGHTAWYNIFLWIAYLAVISLGLGAAWKRWRWRGLLPLAFSVGYVLASALSRYSSWRYDFPADWIAYFYFGVGFAELLGQSAGLFGVLTAVSGKSLPDDIHSVGGRFQVRNILMAAGLFVFIGGLPWMAKNLASPRYSNQDPVVLLAQAALIDGGPTREELRAFALQPEAFIQVGRLLYPRFFHRGAGLASGTSSPAYAIRDYPRVAFYLLNQTSTAVVFPMDVMPGPVPHAEDAIVLGCRRDTFIEAVLIVFPRLNIYYVSPAFNSPCSN